MLPRNSILIVDHQPDQVQALATALARDGNVTVLGSCAAAWAWLDDHQPELVMIDVDSADGSGYQLARRLRDDRTLAHVPVVLMSARLDPQVESLGLQLGAADVIGKPLQIEITRLRVAGHLDRARLAIALARSLRAGGLALWEGSAELCRLADGGHELLGLDEGVALPWRELVHAQDLPRLAAALQQLAGTGIADAPAGLLALDLRLRRHGGSWLWVALQGRRVDQMAASRGQPGAGAAPQALAGTLVDISGRKQLEAALREREAGLSALLGSLHDLVLTLDGQGQVTSCHLPAEFELELPQAGRHGGAFAAWLPAGIAGPLHDALAGLALDGRRRGFECSWPAPAPAPAAGGQAGVADAAPQRLRHGLASLSLLQAPLERPWPAPDRADAPASAGALLVLRDITEHKVEEDAIRQLAYFDPLTGLPNRRLLHDRLRQVQASSHRRQRHGALIFIDLDHFKEVNDRWGHRCGDQLLVELARRLQVSVRACDTVARLGGDEFVVVLADLDAQAAVARTQLGQIATKMLARLARAYELDTHRHRCTASLGAVIFLGNEPTLDELIACADSAMYRAKAAGRNALSLADG
ncbi:MAG: hypothetical protein RLZZ584_3765 [Pseudomonadota bacterium]|jgi:diguanylate cyclase (GGDEF)-like protein